MIFSLKSQWYVWRGSGHFISKLKWNFKKTITPVKHCIHFPLINSTLCCALTVVTSKQSWILTNQGENWPGWPLLTFHFDLCLSTGLPALPYPLRCRVFTLIRSVFIFYSVFIYTCLVLLCLSVATATVCGLVAQRLNEECVQKPRAERTHSEGTSRRTGRHKRRNTAWHQSPARTHINTPFILSVR